MFLPVSSASSQKAATHTCHHSTVALRHSSDSGAEISREGAQLPLAAVCWWCAVCVCVYVCVPDRQRQGKMATQESGATKATESNGEVK